MLNSGAYRYCICMKNKSTAVILAIIFGGLGIHHFYLGNTKNGLIYIIVWLLFFWTVFVPVILWIIELIEGINLANKSQYEFDALYNSNVSRSQCFYNDNYNNEHTSRNQKSKTEQLLDLKKLYDAGVLTEEEFNTQKSKILNS